jgi:hypothetical protein
LELGDKLHSTAKADDNRAQYRSAIKRFAVGIRASYEGEERGGLQHQKYNFTPS